MLIENACYKQRLVLEILFYCNFLFSCYISSRLEIYILLFFLFFQFLSLLTINIYIGGSDTAGLGGRGGPFRLSSSSLLGGASGEHLKHQVSDAAKAEVSAEARAIAAQMGKEALQQVGMLASVLILDIIIFSYHFTLFLCGFLHSG